MTFLYEELDILRKAGAIGKLPDCIPSNLNQNFDLRKYQKVAFENFITYFENDNFRHKPAQVLFHMATGSGKTLIMAGLVLYLYEQGYRNFLFFVNSTNVLQKTRENFLEQSSTKYLFNSVVVINHEPVQIKEVSNFQYSDSDAINICFTTIQGLHDSMFFARENSMTFEDFRNQKTVLLADEAHHLNVSTKGKGKKKVEDEIHNWENTVKTILNTNPANVLLEFTATCDLSNEAINKEYTDKIVCNYPLARFREDKFSKEIRTLRSDVSIMDRALQAIILSQYRLKVFQNNGIFSKPVVLFKSSKIEDSKQFYNQFAERINTLSASEVERIMEHTSDQVLTTARDYFSSNEISYDQLATELKDEFNENHCIIVNSESIGPNTQTMLNSLEDRDNPYRGIFDVKQLDEGWDVLNLFDIVRLSETRQSGGKAISATTVSEAQLIGRGARYFPFIIDGETSKKYLRKFDDDVSNPMRICEEMYYHCQNDSRYIGELHNALREIGVEIDRKVEFNYVLKDSFKLSDVYIQGKIFANERKLVGRADATGLLEKVRGKTYKVSLYTGLSKEENILALVDNGIDSIKTESKVYRIKEIADINYNVVFKAMRRYPLYSFNVLKSYYPVLKSVREFVTSDNFLGNICVQITTAKENVDKPYVLYEALLQVLDEIRESIESVEDVYIGTKEFYPRSIAKIFKDKKMIYKEPESNAEGRGVSQNDPSLSNELRLDLRDAPWFATDDNPGTSEEKACVKFIYGFINKLKSKYKDVYLIRNEEQLKIFSFGTGEVFEPDYVLLLRKQKTDAFEQIQVFIEAKGTHLIPQDIWKEKLLLELKSRAIPTVKFATNNSFMIWGFHFYNQDNRMQEFTADIESLLS